MGTVPVPYREIRRTVALWDQALAEGWPAASPRGTPNAVGEVLRQLGLSNGSRTSVMRRLDTAIALGIEVPEWPAPGPQFVMDQQRKYSRYDDDYVAARAAALPPHIQAPAAPRRPASTRERGATPASPGPRVTPSTPYRRTSDPAPVSPGIQDTTRRPSPTELSKKLVPLLRGRPSTFEELMGRLDCDAQDLREAISVAVASGISIHERGLTFYLDTAPPLGSQRETRRQIVSDKNGIIRFAAVGDTHLGSKYCRLDCLEDFYDHVVKRGLSLVLHAGNWVDGEAPFNRHDLLVHGMDPQMQYLAKHYPRRPGVECWAITGEDHEGWWSRREGVDVGRYAENVMRHAGREDWHDVGFMEGFIDLVHGGTGKSCKLCLMHPGGGSAYAVSYAPQKIVEGFDGGDKPAVLLLGHYHKHSYNLIRNVHTFQVGCFEDQTIFMRQRKLAAHLGGWFIELELDPHTGACIQGGGFFRNYFVRDYYNGRWSQHGPVQHAPRSA